MKTRTTIAAIAVTAAAGITTVAGVASAQGDEAPPARGGAKREFVCANLEQIQLVQADRATLLADHLVLLGSARSAAEASGNTEALERIDKRTARVTERQTKVAERTERLEAFAAEQC